MTIYPKPHAGSPLTAGDYNLNIPAYSLTDLLAYPAGYAPVGIYAAVSAGSRFMTLDEGFRYEVAASAATDHHLTTAGGLKLYVVPSADGFRHIQAFGAPADNATDIYNFLHTAIYKVPEAIARIDLGVGDYYCSKTFHFKKRVHIKGAGGGGTASSALTRVRFPTENKGFWVNRADTYAGRPLYFFADVAAMIASTTTPANYHTTAWLHAYATDELFQIVPTGGDYVTAGGVRLQEIARSSLDVPIPPEAYVANWWISKWAADASRFENFEMDGTARNITFTTAQRVDPTAPHGMHSQARIYLREMTFTNFAGCGCFIYADVTTKVTNPLVYGNASLCQIDVCCATGNGGNGFHFQGYDVNACKFEYLDTTYNGRWGVWDRGFLGNIHIGHHISANGDGSAAYGNPNDTGCRVSFGGTYWVAYDAGTDALVTEQQLVDTQPGTNPLIWAAAHEPASGFGSPRQPLWVAGKPLGTYFHGGAYKMFGASAPHVIIYCYTERLQGPSVAGAAALVLGGAQGAGYKAGGALKGSNGNLISAREFRTTGIPGDDETGGQIENLLNVTLGGNSNTLIGLANMTNDAAATYRLKELNGNLVFDRNNDVGTGGTPFYITTTATLLQLGTGVVQPKHFVARNLAIGNGNEARRHDTLVAAPTTGTWARGAIVYNRDPVAGGSMGWICTATGTPGTWKTWGTIAT